MRIVVDMQGAQTGGHFSKQGHDIISLVQAMVRNGDEHEFILVANDLLADASDPIRAAFDGLLPQDRIRVFSVIGPIRDDVPENALRRDVAEGLRESFLANQSPDVVLVTSLFEGFDEDAVTSIGVLDQNTPTAVALFKSLPSAKNELRHNFCAGKVISLDCGGLYLDWSDKCGGEASKITRITGLNHLTRGFSPPCLCVQALKIWKDHYSSCRHSFTELSAPTT